MGLGLICAGLFVNWLISIISGTVQHTFSKDEPTHLSVMSDSHSASVYYKGKAHHFYSDKDMDSFAKKHNVIFD